MARVLRRVKAHRVFAGACAIAALVCIAFQISRPVGVFWVSGARSVEIGLNGGGLWVWVAGEQDFAVHSAGWHRVTSTPVAWTPEFRIDRSLSITRVGPAGSTSSVVDGVFVFAPLWIVGTLLTVPPVVWLVERRRRRPGHCVCGYDLAGLPTKQCPECGREISG